jgi:hypothetical protein
MSIVFDCAVCGQLCDADQRIMREMRMLDRLSLPKEPVCDECEMAFWRNLGLLDLFGRPTKR